MASLYFEKLVVQVYGKSTYSACFDIFTQLADRFKYLGIMKLLTRSDNNPISFVGGGGRGGRLELVLSFKPKPLVFVCFQPCSLIYQ